MRARMRSLRDGDREVTDRRRGVRVSGCWTSDRPLCRPEARFSAMGRPRITDGERRRRVIARHHLGRTAPDVESAVADLVVLHSSDPISPHLSLWARVPEFTVDDLDDAIREHRTLWRLHAMRRTIWIAGAHEARVLEGAAGRKVAAAERRRIVKWLAADPTTRDPSGEVDALSDRILDALADGPASTRDLADRVDGFDRRITMGSGKWTQDAPLGPRVLYLLAMELAIVRGANAGTFRSSQYDWARSDRWFGEVPDPLDVREAQRRLCARYLLRFGPVTRDDVQWWTGWTKGDTTRALQDAGAVEVVLADGVEAWLHPDDPGGDGAADRPTVSLLPSLDPTAMGWRGRNFHLDEVLVPDLFDRNGNVGPTVWVDGRIVGGWSVRPDASVAAKLLTDIAPDARRLVDAEVDRLADWLDVPVTPRFPTPLEKRLRTA